MCHSEMCLQTFIVLVLIVFVFLWTENTFKMLLFHVFFQEVFIEHVNVAKLSLKLSVLCNMDA